MMKVITWDVDDAQATVEMLDYLPQMTQFLKDVENDELDTDTVKTDLAIAFCKKEMIGEYHGLLIKNKEEYLVDSEIYVLTWDGDASEGGDMFLLDVESLIDIIFTEEEAVG